MAAPPPNPPSNPPPNPPPGQPQPPYAEYASYAAYADPRSYARYSRSYARWMRSQMRAQRRSHYHRSLLGPLLLIGIGVVALLANLHLLDMSSFWSFYHSYWPMLLIGMGLLLAAEAIVVRSQQHCSLQVGCGTVLLLLLLAGLGLTTALSYQQNWSSIRSQLRALNDAQMWQFFGHRHEGRQTLTLSIPTHGTLVVNNKAGNITVRTSPDAQLHVTLDKSVYAGSDADAQRRLDALQPLQETEGSTTTLRIPSNFSNSVALTLDVPAGVALQAQVQEGGIDIAGRNAAVTAETHFGNVTLDGVTGPVQVTLQAGNATLQNVTGPVTLHGQAGEFTLTDIHGAATLDGEFFGNLHLQRVTGPVRYHSSRTNMDLAAVPGTLTLDPADLKADGITGPVEIATRAKDITLSSLSGPLHLHNSDGFINVQAGSALAAMDMDNTEGGITLTLPADARFTVDATANGGKVQSDFALNIQSSDTAETAQGTVHGGGPMLHLTTYKDSITLKKE
jgi:hypothetical protein